MRRYNYVTPTSYLQLLATFRAVLREKRDEIGTARRRLSVGLDKISATEKDVAQMQIDLKELQPVLVKTSAEVEDLMVKIAKDKEDAAEKKAVVEVEEAAAAKKAAECKEIADRFVCWSRPAVDTSTRDMRPSCVSYLQRPVSAVYVRPSCISYL